MDSGGVHQIDGSGRYRLDITVIGRASDGRCIIRFREFSLTPIDGGGEEIPFEEEPIRDLRIVPDVSMGPAVVLWTLAAIFYSAPFTAAEVVRWTRDGKTSMLIEELGPLAFDAKRLDEYLTSIVGVPAGRPGGGRYVLHRAGADRYRVSRR